MNQETNKKWKKVLMVKLLVGMACETYYFTFFKSPA